MLADDYPVSLLCDLLACPRSSYYYQPTLQDETEVKTAIEEVVIEWPTYGYRRVTKQLRRKGRTVNKKRVQRLMRGMGLSVKTKRKARKTTNSQHDFPRYPNLVQDIAIVRPDQVWVSDITYIRLRDEFVYLAVIMDVFTRGIRGWHLGRSLDQTLTLIALDRALAGHKPEIHHSDQGIQYAAGAYTQMLRAAGAEISMADIGEAWQNGYAESLPMQSATRQRRGNTTAPGSTNSPVALEFLRKHFGACAGRCCRTQCTRRSAGKDAGALENGRRGFAG